MAKGSYPSKEHIAQVFSNVGVGDYDTFFSYVAPDVGQSIISISKKRHSNTSTYDGSSVDEVARSSQLLVSRSPCNSVDLTSIAIRRVDRTI